jgi:hypothetical protein
MTSSSEELGVKRKENVFHFYFAFLLGETKASSDIYVRHSEEAWCDWNISPPEYKSHWTNISWNIGLKFPARQTSILDIGFPRITSHAMELPFLD